MLHATASTTATLSPRVRPGVRIVEHINFADKVARDHAGDCWRLFPENREKSREFERYRSSRPAAPPLRLALRPACARVIADGRAARPRHLIRGRRLDRAEAAGAVRQGEAVIGGVAPRRLGLWGASAVLGTAVRGATVRGAAVLGAARLRAVPRRIFLLWFAMWHGRHVRCERLLLLPACGRAIAFGRTLLLLPSPTARRRRA
jgi:hypothetical protein